MNSLGISSYEQLRALPDKESKRSVLTEEFSTQSVKELATLWGCEVHNLYDMRRNLGMPNTRSTAAKPPKAEAAKRQPSEPGIEKENKKAMANTFEMNSFSVRLVLTTKGEEISDRLMRIVDILNKDSSYQLTFDIKEIKLDPKPAEPKEAVVDSGQAETPEGK